MKKNITAIKISDIQKVVLDEHMGYKEVTIHSSGIEDHTFIFGENSDVRDSFFTEIMLVLDSSSANTQPYKIVYTEEGRVQQEPQYLYVVGVAEEDGYYAVYIELEKALNYLMDGEDGGSFSSEDISDEDMETLTAIIKNIKDLG